MFGSLILFCMKSKFYLRLTYANIHTAFSWTALASFNSSYLNPTGCCTLYFLLSFTDHELTSLVSIGASLLIKIIKIFLSLKFCVSIFVELAGKNISSLLAFVYGITKFLLNGKEKALF